MPAESHGRRPDAPRVRRLVEGPEPLQQPHRAARGHARAPQPAHTRRHQQQHRVTGRHRPRSPEAHQARRAI